MSSLTAIKKRDHEQSPSTPTQAAKLKYKNPTIIQPRWRSISDSTSSLFSDMLKPLVVIAIVIILIVLMSEGLQGLFSSIRLIGTKGNLQTPPYIAIYKDRNCTNPAFYVEWGSVEPGITRSVTLYIRNEGNVNVNLSIDTTNWQPANISSYMSLAWDYSGTEVFPDETLQVDLMLLSSSSSDFTDYLLTYNVKEFSFDIIINAFS